MKKKNILVTGGSGRLGNFVCPYLKSKGYNVASFDVVPTPAGSANDVENIPFVQGELTNLGDCMRAISFAQADVIVHLAAIPHNVDLQPPFKDGGYNMQITDGARFRQSMREDATMHINTMGSFYIMDAARRMNVKHVVAACSYFVLGIGFRLSGTSYQPEYLPMDENHPLLPEDSYSLSKVLGEEIYKSFVRAYDMRVVALRLLGVFYHDNERFQKMYKFGINAPAATEENKGYLISNTFQYADARDISRFVELSIEATNLDPFEAFFVSTDTTYVEPTAEVVAKRWPFLKEMGKDIPGTDGLISIDKAKKLLGYEPQHSWRK